MPKLILDAAAIHIATQKLAGRTIFSGPNGGLLAPGVVDLVDDDAGSNRWQPADERTRLLALGGEACRDLVFLAEGFAKPETRRRASKALSVPVCSLMDVVTKLGAKLNDEESRRARQAWPQHDQKLRNEVGKRLKKQRLRGPVRKVRNKVGAHLDTKAFVDDAQVTKLKAEDLLGAMADALVLLMLALKHPNVFAWIRGHGFTQDARYRLVETMFGFPIAVSWMTDLDGHVQDVSIVRIAEDPRLEVQDSLLAAVEAYNDMVDTAGLSIPKIWTRPTEDLHREEQTAKAP